MPGTETREATGDCRLPHALMLDRFPLMQSCDPECARDYLTHILSPHQLEMIGGKRSVHFKHNSVAVDRSTLHFIEYGPDAEQIRVTAPEVGHNVLVKIPLAGKALVRQDRTEHCVEPGVIFVAQSGRSFECTMSSDYRQLTLQVDMSVLLAAVAAELGEGIEQMVFDPTPIDSAGAGRLLSKVIVTVCSELDANDSAMSHLSVQKTFQNTLLSLILNLPNSHKARIDEARPCAAPYYVRRAEDYMRSNLTEEIGLDDLVKVAGASRRSLHAGFRRFRNTTPLGMLKTLRLEATKKELERADGHGNTVTKIATEYGFYHLSKFTKDFKESFGRLPSEVLRRTAH